MCVRFCCILYGYGHYFFCCISSVQPFYSLILSELKTAQSRPSQHGLKAIHFHLIYYTTLVVATTGFIRAASVGQKLASHSLLHITSHKSP